MAAIVAVVGMGAPRMAASESRIPATYVVQPGDTLSDIADRFGLDVDTLASLNGLTDPSRIVAGTTLRLRADGASSPVAIGTRTYRVQAGDTLWEIAQSFGIQADEIAALNDIGTGSLLRIGDELEIPSAPASRTTTAAAARTYVVSSGDTLSDIADAYGVTVASIRNASHLMSDLIRVGQVLSIPAAPKLPHLSAQTEAALREAADESGVDPYLLMALSLMESGWQNHVVSSTGAIGLMQLMPDTAEWTVDFLASGADNWHVSLEDNARVGAAYFAHLLFIEGGDVEGALASYYQGWGSYKRHGMYEETRDYVDDVLALEGRLRAKGAGR